MHDDPNNPSRPELAEHIGIIFLALVVYNKLFTGCTVVNSVVCERLIRIRKRSVNVRKFQKRIPIYVVLEFRREKRISLPKPTYDR